MTWNIILTRPQSEFRAMAGLADYGFTAYLPTIRIIIRLGPGRTRVPRMRPMFPGYLFLYGAVGRHSLVHRVSGFRGFLMANVRLATLSAHAVALVRHAEVAMQDARPVSKWSIGDRVRINKSDHPAHLLEGVVQSLDKHDRAVLDIIGRPLAVAIDTNAAWLEPA